LTFGWRDYQVDWSADFRWHETTFIQENIMSQLLHLSDNDFDANVNHADKAVIIDFWANWCGPCRALGPTIEKLAEEFDGKLIVGKVDVDQAPALSSKFRIQSIPRIIGFRNGVEVGRVIGNNPAKVRELAESLAN
jgi:thioredoxin 1